MSSALSDDASATDAAFVDPALRTDAPVTERVKAPSRARALLLAALLSAGLGGGGYWYATRALESTDNAQIDADVIAVPARIGGTVARVHFVENQPVKEGALLAELDDAPFRARLAQAEAALEAALAQAEVAHASAEVVSTNAVGNRAIARANLTTNAVGAKASSDEIREGEAQLQTARAKHAQARLELERARALFDAGAFTKAQFDTAQTAEQIASAGVAAQAARLSSLELARAEAKSRVVEATAKVQLNDQVETLVRQAKAAAAAADAQVATARAARDLAALELSYTKIRAPHDGVASKKSVNAGQSVASGQTIVQVVPDARWVTANFKETQLARMRAGQPVHFTVDAYPGVELEGEVESFSGATGARFTLLPPDNATGNFTKVVQRVPVRIRVHEVPKAIELRPGMSVELSVDTSKG